MEGERQNWKVLGTRAEIQKGPDTREREDPESSLQEFNLRQHLPNFVKAHVGKTHWRVWWPLSPNRIFILVQVGETDIVRRAKKGKRG